jgi:hypothetical protein
MLGRRHGGHDSVGRGFGAHRRRGLFAHRGRLKRETDRSLLRPAQKGDCGGGTGQGAGQRRAGKGK